MPSIADRLLRIGHGVRRSHTGTTVTFRGASLAVTIDNKPMDPKDQRNPNFATKQMSRVEVLVSDLAAAPRAGESFIDSEADQSHRIEKVTRIGDYYECDCHPSEAA